MARLARKLRLFDYFSVGFGAMVGAGWLVLMGDWLRRGGPLGAIVGFMAGALLLLPVASTYGRLAAVVPDAGAEIAYTQKVFPEIVSFGTGWVMILAYLVVCPWEAVAIGKIAGYVLPSLQHGVLYHLGGTPVYWPHVVLGLGITAALTTINYRGITASARLQNWTSIAVLVLAVALAFCGARRASAANLRPLFSGPPLLSILLVLQIVPYFLTGWEAIPKCSEEARPEFGHRRFLTAMVLALFVGAGFHALMIGIVALLAPWRLLVAAPFASAVAFERAFGSPIIVNFVLATALIALVKVDNGNFLAATRLLFALGRARMVTPVLGRVHERYLSPASAALAIGAVTMLAIFLGDTLLVAVTEVGSLASAVGWFMTCLSCMRMRGVRGGAVPAAGAAVSSIFILIKVLPFVPGRLSAYEYVALAIWLLVGFSLYAAEHAKARRASAAA